MKHLIPLLSVTVNRDITAKPRTQVGEHEIPILKAIHGEDNVFVHGPVGEATAIDIDREVDRVQRKFGKEAVFDAYGARADRDIRRTLSEVSVGTVEDSQSAIRLDGPDTKTDALGNPIRDVCEPAQDQLRRRLPKSSKSEAIADLEAA